MKRIALFLVAILATNLPASSTIHTVCNMPYSPGQHLTYQAAEAIASDGDTIYLHGSNIGYGFINVTRQVVIIGAGFNPNKQLPMTSTLEEVFIANHNVQLIGLTIDYLVTSGTINNLTIRKCRFIGSGIGGLCIDGSGTNWVIEGNIFDAPSISFAIDLNSTAPHTIQNNIFATLGSAIREVGFAFGPQCHILNNLFLGDGSGSGTALSSTADVTVRNNIFYGMLPYYIGGQPQGISVIERNLSFACSDNAFYPVGSYPNNLEGADPLFSLYNLSPTPYQYSNDFRLFPGSPGIGYGSDGTDIGVFGGISEAFTVTGEPSIAEITVFDITSPTTVAPGGTLTISVTSKRVK